MIVTAYDEAIRVCGNLLIGSGTALLVYIAVCVLTWSREFLPETVQHSWFGTLLNLLHDVLTTTSANCC